MRVQWHGGPWDGEYIEVPDWTTKYVAVAWCKDHGCHAVPDYPELQRHAVDPLYYTRDPYYDTAKIVLYPILHTKTMGRLIRYKEHK